MIRNLQGLSGGAASIDCDVAIVGGGIAGLLLGTRLARAGVHVVILESGGVGDGAQPHPLNEVIQAGQPYRGAEEGRFRGLGGTSVRWGGAMLPFQACDMGPHTAGWEIDWPVSIGELAERFDELENLFHLPVGPFDGDPGAVHGNDETPFQLRSAKWPQFRWRNIARVLKSELARPDLEIWINATVAGFNLQADGRLGMVRARAPDGAELKVASRVVVIAAGAIESTRLMLLLDLQHDNRLFRPHKLLGHYFFDHMSAPAATIEPPLDRRGLNETFGLRFDRSGMRDVRIEPSAHLRRKKRLPGGFAHVTATSATPAGFESLREVYRNLQSGEAINWTNVLGVARDPAWLVGATWWLLARRRLLAPRDAQYNVVMVTEQYPNWESRITLSEAQTDAYGVPMCTIDWRTSPCDIEAFRTLQTELAAYWLSSPFHRLGRLSLVPETEWLSRLQSSSDIFHPGGTTRMARGPSVGVVDADLRSFQCQNLYVVSTSVFPSGGGANPTFTLMALALRAADRIAAEVAK